ncbi:MAG: TolC family protein [Acidobacteria bacterium]|nr:TolC family protein [Acidobacteriota bacterium]
MVAALLISLAPSLRAQEREPLSLAAAHEAARRVHPGLTAAKEAVVAAEARERQAGAFPNPTVAYSREKTSGDGQANGQNIASIGQPIEFGLRGVRRDVARARREAAEAQLARAESDLRHDVTVAYARVVAADRRARIAARAGAAFTEALRVSEQRLAAGDVAGYAHRRLRLEVAHAATVRAEAVLAAQTARVALSSLVTAADAPTNAAALTLSDTLVARSPAPDADSLVALAVRTRAELRALVLDARAAGAEARLAARERTPVPVLSAGFKNERVKQPGTSNLTLGGFIAGISLPLPVFDRRSGAVDAANAETRRQLALVAEYRRRVTREVLESHHAYRVALEQVALLEPVVGPDAHAALAAADVAYAEGEITLVEWLDVMRSYREAEATLASLQSETLIRRAALERAVGTPLSQVP